MTIVTETAYQMSDEHKAHLALGRERSRIVRRYLDTLNQAPRRGRRRTVETVQDRLVKVNELIASEPNTLRLLQLVAERERLQEELAAKEAETPADVAAFEAEFIKVAKDYSERKNISYAAWRELGVPASVLRAADITR